MARRRDTEAELEAELEIQRLRREVARLQSAERAYREIVNRTNAIVLRWDPEGRILFMNDFGQRLFGYTEEELVGRSVLELIVPDTDSSGRDLHAMIRDLLGHPERYVANENENVGRDGRRHWITWRNTTIVDSKGQLVEILSTGLDTTDRKRAEDALRASEERFRELSVRDNLTGLYNTRYLYQELEDLIAASADAGVSFSILFLDLDHFKRVVDSRGHLNGSRAIQEVAASISSCLASPAWAVAYAGDEFVVVLPGVARAAALDKAREIQACIRETHYLGATGRTVRISASFGVATFPDDARDLVTLLALGDQALFSVKDEGRGGIAAAGAQNAPAAHTRSEMLDYDPTDWNTQIDPYPVFARLREEAPVYHNEKLRFWALSRFEDVWDAHLDHETFSSTMGPTLEQGIKPLPMMIIMDPPQHTRVRQLVSKVFTPRRVAELEATVRQITRERLAGLEPGDQIDLFERLGSSMPMDVISTLLGVPAADRDRIRHLTNTAMHREGGLEIPASARQAQAEVHAYYVDFIEDRQAHPGADLLSDLIAAEIRRDDGELTRLDSQELLGFCLLLGNAGHETTARLICNSAVTLARHPDQRRQLVTAPRPLMENAVEEMLRYDPPSQVQGRWTTRAWTKHGVTIPAEVRVLLLTGAAHRDERQFPDPDRFDIHRRLDRTVHFGQGHHLCLGKSLARQECRVAFEEILARFPDYEVDEHNLEWAHNNNVRGYSKVPMRL